MAERIQIDVQGRLSDTTKQKMQQQLNAISNSLRLNINVGSGATSGNQGLNALGGALGTLSTQIGRLNSQFNTLSTSAGQANNGLRNVGTGAQVASQHTRTLGENIALVAKKFAMWISATSLFYGSLRFFKQGIQDLTQIDKQLIEISKVTDLTAQQLDKLATTASNVGVELGRTAQEYLQATASFAKTGMDEKTSQELAKVALLMSNVGDMDIADSNSAIIATVEGLGLAYEDAGSIVDKFNKISNNNATTVSKLAEGMKNFASTAQLAGLSLDQTVALIGTGSAVTQKSGSEIANALKTITMRLQGVTDNQDTFEEDLSKSETQLRSIGIEIRDSADSFRPVMDVLDELGGKFTSLSEIEQAAVTEALGGKMRAGILKSILLNYDTVQKQLTESQSSYGSALAENNKYMDGIEAKTKQLKATMTSFWQTSINSSASFVIELDSSTNFIDISSEIRFASACLLE